MNLRPFLAPLALVALLAHGDDFATEFLNKTYPAAGEALATFNENHVGSEPLKNCHFAAAAKDSKDGYCLELLGEKTVGGRRYLFFSGPNLDNTVAASGRDELWLLAKDGEGWKELTHGGGASFANEGRSSQAVEWLQIGPERWAAVADGGMTQNGLSQDAKTLYWVEGDRVKSTTRLSGTNDAGAGGCDDSVELKGSRCLDLSGTLAARSDLPAVAGFYPLEMTINGSTGLPGSKQRVYKDEKFTFNYDEKSGSYQAPKDYPAELQAPDAAQ